MFQYQFPHLEVTQPPAGENRPLRMSGDDLFIEAEGGTWVQSVSIEKRHSFSGDPTQATREKGRLIVKHIIERSGIIIAEMRQQMV